MITDDHCFEGRERREAEARALVWCGSLFNLALFRMYSQVLHFLLLL